MLICAPDSIPNGIKNMLAIECSNPKKTKSVTGIQQAKDFAISPSAENAIHTASTTIILHNIPLVNASMKVRFTFASAIAEDV